MLDDNSITTSPEQWKAEGEARLLIRSLERKFGKLNEETRATIYQLEADTLLDCVERLATAQSIAEVLPQTGQPMAEDNELATATNLDQPTVMRTTKGLSITGTRLNLYDLMDYLTQNWPIVRVQQWFRLTNKQINDIVEYLDHHYAEVEAEYWQVLEYAEEKRHYWQERQRSLNTTSPSPKRGRTEFWTILRQRQLERRTD